MEIIPTKNNTKIIDSYKITDKKEIEKYLSWIIEERKAKKYHTRSLKSYQREWLGHNFLYKLGLFKSHTKDVDLEERLTPKEKIKGLFMDLIWLIIGGI